MTTGDQIREQRRQERFQIDRQPQGELAIRVGATSHAVLAVRDVSGSGISVLVDCDVSVPAQVAVEYVEPNLKLEVFGTAVWCEPRAIRAGEGERAGSHVMGIALLSPMMLAALLQKHA